jgi:predicted O-linked N-acetylglucosamine transferase (SPINDLY family)
MTDLISARQARETARHTLAQGQPAEAIARYQGRLDAEPASPQAHWELAFVYLELGQEAQALRHLERLLALQPTSLPVLWQLAECAQQISAHESLALQCYRRILQLQPTQAEACFQIGVIHFEQGRFAEALEAQRRTLALLETQVLPDLKIKAYLYLGHTFQALERHKEALVFYTEVLQCDPHHAEALEACLHLEIQKEPQLRIWSLIEMCKRFPDLRTQIIYSAAWLAEKWGNVAEARLCYQWMGAEQAPEQRGIWELKQALLVPLFPIEQGEQTAEIQRLQQALIRLAQQDQRAFETSFPQGQNLSLLWHGLHMLPYTGHDPLRWRQILARVLQKALPVPRFVPAALRTDRRQVGFVMQESNAVDAFLLGLLARIPPESCQVTFFYTTPFAELYYRKKMLRPDGRHLLLAEGEAALEQILTQAPDILYYPEPNTTHAAVTFLASFRLAPIQCTSWLSSGTTGQPDMDYFLSSTLLEPPENQCFYSEQLILQQTLPAYFKRPVWPGHYSRSDFGLPEQGRIYLCTHPLCKIQPDLDALLGGILRADPGGHVVLLYHPAEPFAYQAVLRRFEQHLPDVMSRIWFLPKMNAQDYRGLLTLGDVMLDPLFFGMGTTCYEALGLDLPIVTWPGARLHARIVQACYQKMGLTGAVADSAETYIEKALALAHETALRRDFRQHLHAHSDCLFEDQQAVEELVDFLCHAQARRSPA